MTRRTAKVTPGGCGIFVTADELRSLGIDPDDVDSLSYAIGEDQIELKTVGKEASEA
jgi:hypothetical protein